MHLTLTTRQFEAGIQKALNQMTQLKSSSTLTFFAATFRMLNQICPTPLSADRTAFPRSRHRKFRPSHPKNQRGR
jgi:hypothetical protein